MTTATTSEQPASMPSPCWPPMPLDLDRIRVGYDVLADEPLVHFDRDRPTGGVCDPIELADGKIAVVYDWESGEIVGIQGIPFLLGAVRYQPEWVALAWGALAGRAGEQTLRRVLPEFVGEVANAFGEFGLAGVPVSELTTDQPNPR